MNQRRCIQIAIATTLIAAIAIVYAVLAVHSSPYEITRTRNALIAKVGDSSDFEWTPASPPADYMLEDRANAPPAFAAAALLDIEEDLPAIGDWMMSLEIAQHLTQGPGIGEGIKSSTKQAYQLIMTEELGYCADYTQVFNGIAIASGIAIREWGLSFDGYSGYGHAFNEIYDSQLRQWIFIDSFYSFYVTDTNSGMPLSVLEFRERLANGEISDISVEVIEPARFAFENHRKALEYYERGADQFFLYNGNNVFSYDRHPVISLLGSWSRALEQGGAILFGMQPRILLFPTETNRDEIDGLFRRRNYIVATLLLSMVLAVVLVLEVRLLWRSRLRHHKPTTGRRPIRP